MKIFVLLGLGATTLMNGAAHPLTPPPQPLPPPDDCELLPLRVTTANLQLLGQAIEQYRTNTNACPVAPDVVSLLAILTPDYLPQAVNSQDGWGRPLRYETWNAGTLAMQHCGLASAGRDGIWEFPSLMGYPVGPAYHLDNDIVMTDGRFTWLYDDPRRSDQDRYNASARWMKILAGALEAYNTDSNSYPTGTLEQVYAQLTPWYIGTIDYRGTTDHWGRPYIYLAWSSTGTLRLDHYVLASAGRDGVWEKASLRDYIPRTAVSYDNDIVLMDGQFIEIVDDPSLTLAQLERFSMGKSKTIASALEQYNTDYNHYPVGTTLQQMLSALQPNYLPGGGFDQDAFRQPLRYVAWGAVAGSPTHYRLASIGRNGTADLPDLCSPLPATRPAGFDDIIMQDGQFITVPDGYSPPTSGNGCAAPAPPMTQAVTPAQAMPPSQRKSAGRRRSTDRRYGAKN